MSYIEFIGPPGSGKSTLYNALISEKDFFGGNFPLRRYFKDFYEYKKRNNIKYKLVYNIYRFMPKSLKIVFEKEILRDRLANTAFLEFIKENPGFLEILSKLAKYKKDRFFLRMKSLAERYQFGIKTIQKKKNLF